MSHSTKILNCITLALMSLLCGCSFDDPEIVIVELSPAQVHSTYEEYSEAHVDDHEPGMLEARSGEWRAVRMAHIRDSPECIACGKREQLYVHHIIPYHVNPKLELERSNLATFCFDHHLGIGHNGNWKHYNLRCVDDAARVRKNLGLEPVKRVSK